MNTGFAFDLVTDDLSEFSLPRLPAIGTRSETGARQDTES